jgi:transcriptional regulator with XRE-family HTH domain
MYPNLKLQLWKCGIRQNRLAKMLEMDETALSRIVNGFREPSVELQNSIAALLQANAAWLFEPQSVASESGAEVGHPPDPDGHSSSKSVASTKS